MTSRMSKASLMLVASAFVLLLGLAAGQSAEESSGLYSIEGKVVPPSTNENMGLSKGRR